MHKKEKNNHTKKGEKDKKIAEKAKNKSPKIKK